MSPQGQNYYKNILIHISKPIIVIDKKNNITFINASALDLCNYGKNNTHFNHAHISCLAHKFGKNITDFVNNALKERKTLKSGKFIYKTNDNSDEQIIITSDPFFNETEEFSGLVLTINFIECERINIKDDFLGNDSFFGIIGKSEEMKYVFEVIKRLANIDSTVLITGETGTGKELIAQAIHKAGIRKDKPLIKVNCSALTESLFESELFGSVKGAYTGSHKDRMGRFESADGGIIFLDEIGDLNMNAQVKLLRFLQEKEFERVGDSKTIKVDTKVVTATNRDLKILVEEGKFRGDLYYRLKVFTVKVPALRDRREDLPLLIDYFLDYYCKKFNRKSIGISDEVVDFFNTYYWPGNIRELKHILEYAVIMDKKDIIEPFDLPEDLYGYFKISDESSDVGAINEREKILMALKDVKWNKSRACKSLGMSRRTLYRKLSKYDII